MGSGPILEEPPLYPPEKMRHMPPADYPLFQEDIDLISSHRRLVRFWKTSPYFQKATPSSCYGKEHERGLEAQKLAIVHSGDVGQKYFPAELLLPVQLKVKGRTTAHS